MATTNPSPVRCSIVPPNVLEHVLQTSTDADTRQSALDTLSVDQSMRNERIHTALFAVPRPVALARGPGGTPDRTIFDARNLEDERATAVLRNEGQAAVSDVAANEAYDGLGATHRLYWEVYRRDSIDDADLPLDGVVHFGKGYNNAFWNGERMVFGDGDGRIFTGFTKSLDVIGHELTHGVTEHTLGLRYMGQAGALNESISDVFGSLVKQYVLGQTADQADWLIGAGTLGPALQGVALRSMKAPGTAFQGDDQPAHMKNYVRTMRDNGGVHTNSGIPNHAFYLAATAISGHAWEKAGAIWYRTLLSSTLRPTSGFRAFASATVRSATTLYGATAAPTKAVRSAWVKVGVL